MNRTKMSKNSFLSEFAFQLILHVVVFIFYSFNREPPHIQSYQFVFFLNYAIAVFVINYALLPQFLYKKKYAAFALFLIIIIATTVFIEEFVLEKIYFPDTRGSGFQGIFYVLLDIMPVIAILSGFKFAWDLIIKQREVEELKASVEKSELNYLKSQINPHFLFNNLNNLYSYALENSDKTPRIILELSSVLRYMLYECREEFVSLNTEILQLHNFVKLNELQIEDRGEVTFAAPESTDIPYKIAPLILMNFVENAFKHCTASQVNDIRISIKMKINKDGLLIFTCENTFQETTNSTRLDHGIGLANVRKRLELIYPNSHTLRISNEIGLFKVHLSIQLN